MIAAMVVVVDEGRDLSFEIPAQEVIFQEDAALDLALRYRIIGSAARRPAGLRDLFASCRPTRFRDPTPLKVEGDPAYD
jgi:hypothetical protein